jgi:hypothetical protein
VANQLKMALVDTIQRLHQQKWSQRRIAKELQIDRETVARYLALQEAPKPASPEEALSDSKPATGEGALSGGANSASASDLNECSECTAVVLTSTPPTAVGSETSQCTPFRDIILNKLDQGLSAQRIWQDLVNEHGFDHRYHSVRRFVARLGAKTPLPFRRLECGPGEEVQVDFGQGAFLVDSDGKRRRPPGWPCWPPGRSGRRRRGDRRTGGLGMSGWLPGNMPRRRWLAGPKRCLHPLW